MVNAVLRPVVAVTEKGPAIARWALTFAGEGRSALVVFGPHLLVTLHHFLA